MPGLEHNQVGSGLGHALTWNVHAHCRKRDTRLRVGWPPHNVGAASNHHCLTSHYDHAAQLRQAAAPKYEARPAVALSHFKHNRPFALPALLAVPASLGGSNSQACCNS